MLSREDVIAVLARLFAVFVLIAVVRSLPAMGQSLTAEGGGWYATFFIGAFVVAPLLIAALIWVFPLTIATKLLPVMRTPRPALSAGGLELEQVGLTILGVWFFVTGLVDAVYWYMFAKTAQDAGFRWRALDPENAGAMVATGAELIIGLALVLGARGIVGALRRLRQAGS